MNPPPWHIPPLGPPRRSPRNRVLAQWRGIDLAPEEIARANKTKTAKDVLPSVLKELRIESRQAEAEIVKVWNGVMDANITMHAQPTGLWKGTLFVAVDSSVWLDEIVRYRRREILERLRHSFGADMIRKVAYRVG
jgi:hypothetical protein